MAEFTMMEQGMLTQDMSDQQKMLFQGQFSSEKKDPSMLLVISVLLGTLGVDRFMLGDTGMGLLKLFTGGLCGILWFIDLFTTTNRTHDFNRKKAQEIAMSIKMTTSAPKQA